MSRDEKIITLWTIFVAIVAMILTGTLLFFDHTARQRDVSADTSAAQIRLPDTIRITSPAVVYSPILFQEEVIFKDSVTFRGPLVFEQYTDCNM